MRLRKHTLLLSLKVSAIGVVLAGSSIGLRVAQVLTPESGIYLAMLGIGVPLFILPIGYVLLAYAFHIRNRIYLRATGKDSIDFNMDIIGKIMSPPSSKKKK